MREKWSLTQSSHKELQALARMLRRAQGSFALGFVRCNAVELRRLLVRTVEDMLLPTGMTIHEVELTARTRDLPGVLAAQEGDGDPLFVYGLERAMPAIAPEWAQAQLNERRGLYQELGRPLIFWLPEDALRRVAKGAPDFWAWRSGVYEFAMLPVASGHMDAGGRTVVSDGLVVDGDFVAGDKRTGIDQRGQEVHGPQSNVAGNVHGPVLSGEFQSSVAVGGEAADRREREMVSLRHQLMEAREHLNLIRERKSQYVIEVDIPSQLIKHERRLGQQIANLEARLAALQK